MKIILYGWLLVIVCFIPLNIFAQSREYISDSVFFYSGKDSVRIAGTVTKPFKGKKHKSIILISGTGKQDRDGTMGGVKLFSIIAEHLTKNGYLVLRMDDRGVGESTGDYAKSTTYDFAMDAISAVNFLRKYPGADPGQIGLLGHSEGGAVICIAASLCKDVKFLISLSGLAMNGLDALISQNEAIVNGSPLKDRDKIRSNEINGLMFKTAYQYADSLNLEEKLNETYTNWKRRDSAYFVTLGEQFDHFRFPIWSYSRQAATPWYRFFIRYNAELYLSYVNVPVLAINGDRDNMVVPVNLDLWKRYTGRNGNNNVTIRLMSGLNHLLQPVSDKKEKTSGEVAPEVLEIIREWLAKY
jgi:hypothetical protein